ncbi:MAG: hypothetical protein EP330_31205 [Deltaproteobacteria bacterium]|nr:MAG: hypothetical protein EP330_31205 [Deltaproteobacteria bacterium]
MRVLCLFALWFPSLASAQVVVETASETYRASSAHVNLPYLELRLEDGQQVAVRFDEIVILEGKVEDSVPFKWRATPAAELKQVGEGKQVDERRYELVIDDTITFEPPSHDPYLVGSEKGLQQWLGFDGFPLYGAYCGPLHPPEGTNPLPDPWDPVDGACKAHDTCYGEVRYFSCGCDETLVSSLPDAMANLPYTDRRLKEARTKGALMMLWFSAGACFN